MKFSQVPLSRKFLDRKFGSVWLKISDSYATCDDPEDTAYVLGEPAGFWSDEPVELLPLEIPQQASESGVDGDFTDFVLQKGGWVESVPAPLKPVTPQESVTVFFDRLPDGNAGRAQRAWVALQAYQAYTKSEVFPRPADLLADLMHYCGRNRLDFQRESQMALEFYGDEA
jgi:hypothetical protein